MVSTCPGQTALHRTALSGHWVAMALWPDGDLPLQRLSCERSNRSGDLFSSFLKKIKSLFCVFYTLGGPGKKLINSDLNQAFLVKSKNVDAIF